MTTEIVPSLSNPLDYLTEIERDPHLKSEHTRRQYRAALNAFEEWRDSRPLTLTLVEEYASTLQKRGLSPSTVNQALAVIRWWARRVVKLADELTDREQASWISDRAQRVISVEGVTGSRAPKGRHLDGWELEALIRACTDDPSPLGVRDAALIVTACVTGCRNEELRALTLDDIKYTPDGADLTIQHGKGDKERVVFLYNGSLAALNAWIDVRGVDRGPLFCPIRKGGKIATDLRLSYFGTWKILQKRFLQSALAKDVTWHDFRRTLAGLLFDQGEDPSTIQQQLGHASIVMTQRYDRRPEARRRAAIRSLDVPYKRENAPLNDYTKERDE